MTTADTRPPCEVDEHPMDGPLGDIHEIAIACEMHGQGNAAITLARAHEALQQHIVAMENDREQVAATLRETQERCAELEASLRSSLIYVEDAAESGEYCDADATLKRAREVLAKGMR